MHVREQQNTGTRLSDGLTTLVNPGQRQNNDAHVREQQNNGTPVRNKTHGYMRKQYNNAQACQFVLTTLVNPRQ
jgi:hypothetical protein